MSEIANSGCPSGLAPPASPPAGPIDPTPFVRERHQNYELELAVTGAKCAGCISKIERALMELPGMQEARLNLSTGKLYTQWQGNLPASRITLSLDELGYRAMPYDPAALEKDKDHYGRFLLRCMAVAGFASANIMLLSVSVWAATDGEMGEATRSLMHLISALIAIPAAAYAGRPFFSSAWNALRKGQANMDVPISLAVFLALGMSLAESLNSGHDAYFDAAVMLLFFLLIGRWLDHNLRDRARSAAQDLLALQATTATRINAQGHAQVISPKDIRPGDILSIAVGDKVPVDSEIIDGESEIDLALLTGEPVPVPATKGDQVSGGAVNVSRPLTVRAKADIQNSLIADLVRLVEAGQQAKGRFTILADKAARAYVPIVHTLALITVIGWLTIGDATLREAIMIATAVLIITCPCALGLATPAVQVVATGELFRRGILVKSGNALERLAAAEHFVFDKTGTLTEGKLSWTNADNLSKEDLAYLAPLARASRHPIARAIVEQAGGGPVAEHVEEIPGEGLCGNVNGEIVLFGRARLIGVPDDADSASTISWLKIGDRAPLPLYFSDELRSDAARTIALLKNEGVAVSLLSGDRSKAVRTIADQLGIKEWQAAITPQDKSAYTAKLSKTAPVAMIGDGINDAPAMAHATVSMSPGSAAEAAQSAADFVFQSGGLGAVTTARDMARRARQHILQNFAFAAVYNALAAPLAMAGLVNPLIAALAMSGSSIIVTVNALRLSSGKKATS